MAIYNNLLWNEKENKNNCFSSIEQCNEGRRSSGEKEKFHFE